MSRFSARRVVTTAAVGFVMTATMTATIASPVSANEDQFSCDPGFYQVIAGQLAELDPANEAYTTVGVDHANYNAMGYRIADGYMYAISGTTLYRITANGDRIDLAQLDIPGGSYAGDFDDDGYLNISRGGREWYKVNVDTFEVQHVPQFDGYTAVADIVNVHGIFYGVSSDGTLYSYDQTSLERSEVGKVSGLPETLKSYGAAWATAGGNLYVGRNSGEIYQITGYTTTSPQATLVGRSPSTNSNDGASCALAAPMAGLDDVDGPEPESEPRTEETIEASTTYTENFDEISKTFTPMEPEPEPELEPDPEPDNSTYAFDDAELGTGPGCVVGGDVDRPERTTNPANADVAEPTSLYQTGFDPSSLEDFTILGGSWTAADGALLQNHDCGYDYTALLNDLYVDHFTWTATFSGVTDRNQGGIIFNQASTISRSGAMVVDFTNDGSVLRWGNYDDKGYYQNVGSMPVEAPVTGQNVTLSIEVHNLDVQIFLNGELVTTTQATHAGGMVGLVATQTAISFDAAELIALPPTDTQPEASGQAA